MTDKGIEVRASYDTFNEGMDTMIYNAAGRVSDFAGGGISGRDHGWVCKNEFEAMKIEKGLKKLLKTAPSLTVWKEIKNDR